MSLRISIIRNYLWLMIGWNLSKSFHQMRGNSTSYQDIPAPTRRTEGREEVIWKSICYKHNCNEHQYAIKDFINYLLKCSLGSLGRRNKTYLFGLWSLSGRPQKGNVCEEWSKLSRTGQIVFGRVLILIILSTTVHNRNGHYQNIWWQVKISRSLSKY